jgi:hypothetical protein
MSRTGEYQNSTDLVTDFDAAFLQAQKLRDGTDSKFLDDEHVQAWVTNIDTPNSWQAEMLWGFEMINGERRYTRRVVVWKGDKVERARLVYDYKGPVDKQQDDEDGLAYGEAS